MQQIVRHIRAVRLLAQTLAIVVALVTVLGSFAHACHDPHQSAAFHEVVAQDGIDGGENEAFIHDKQPTPHHIPHKSTPHCCADLQCHGGIAILGGHAPFALSAQSAESIRIADQTHEDAHLARLDRPPRFTVQF